MSPDAAAAPGPGPLAGALAVARLELAEVLRSRWLAFTACTYAALAAIFIVAGLHESSVFGYTGSGRALVALTHALLVMLPLLALMATGQVVTQARADGSLELLFSHPITRESYFCAVTLVRFGVVLLPLVLFMGAIVTHGRLAHGEAVPWAYVARCLSVSAALSWSFVGMGLLVSTLVRSQAKAVIWMLVLWVLGVAFLDFALAGLMLEWRFNARTVFALAALNPVQAARMALLSSADPELAVLGPVGFYLSNRIGSGALVALGTAWPLILGSGAWLFALLRFRRQDVT